MKDGFYFPHFSTARGDRKLKRVIKDMGVEGYGIYFMILEILRDQSDFRYPMKDVDLLADECKVEEGKVRKVIDNYELFEIADENFFSPSQIECLQPYLIMKEQRRLAGSKSGESRKLKALKKAEALEKAEANESELEKEAKAYTRDTVIEYLNEVTGKKFTTKSKKTNGFINSRVRDGYSVDNFKTVIDTKTAEWSGTDMAKFLRPETLFGQKFESYLNEGVKPIKKDRYKKFDKSMYD